MITVTIETLYNEACRKIGELTVANEMLLLELKHTRQLLESSSNEEVALPEDGHES